jgi:hypothetical protein
MIDLDVVQSRIKAVKVRTDMTLTGPAYEVVRDVSALVAELRTARQVVEATRGWLRDGEAAGSTDVIRAVTTALTAHDKATGEASR